jgi:hypothetical protein
MASQKISLRSLNRATLARQMLLERAELPIATAVERLAGLQAQHPDWPRVGLWSRLSGLGPTDLAEALARREVVRATLMRSTLHIVSAADFWAFSAVTLPVRQNQFRLYFKEEATDPGLIDRLRPAHEAALAALAEKPRSMAELRTVLNAAAPKAAKRHELYLGRHFTATVPLIDFPAPAGEARYGRSSYVSAADWQGPPPPEAVDPQRALALVAERYLGAFGPASGEDFAAWLGRRWTQVRPGIEALADRLVTFTDETGRELFDLADAPRPSPRKAAPTRFLARWDSLLLGHQPKFRTRILWADHHAVVNRANADVLPTFLVDGFVAGTWRHGPSKRNTPGQLELSPLRRLSARELSDLRAEAKRLVGFLDQDAQTEVHLIDG